MEKIEIEEIKKYVDELVAQLRVGGQHKNVEGLLAITERFKQPSEVRSAVYSLDQAVRQWLRNGGGQPLDPATQLTAQFLVDACKNALAQGAIRSLRPTPRESARKLGRLAGMTLAIGSLVVLVPVVLLFAGVNWVDMLMPPRLAGTTAERERETVVPLQLASAPPVYDHPIDVRIELAGKCRGPLWDELSCDPSERLWDDGVRHPTFHLVRTAEVSGIMVAVRDVSLRGAQGGGELLVYVDKDTAAGEYLIPLQGMYVTGRVVCAAPSDAGTNAVSDAGTEAAAEACDPHAEPMILAHSAIASALIRVP